MRRIETIFKTLRHLWLKYLTTYSSLLRLKTNTKGMLSYKRFLILLSTVVL